VESPWGAWNDEDEDDMDMVYPDAPVQTAEEGPRSQYFTDLEDYSEQGPSFQKLILLATARNRHRAIRVPTSSSGLTIAVL
jgi:hypothetical protein